MNKKIRKKIEQKVEQAFKQLDELEKVSRKKEKIDKEEDYMSPCKFHHPNRHAKSE